MAGSAPGLLGYLRHLPRARQVLWCYLIWYLVMAAHHFDPSPRLWLTSLGISGVIGVGLILSVSSDTTRRDFWTTARLFLMPFCVSSFSALIKDRGFMLILSPRWQEDAIAVVGCGLFLLLVHLLQRQPAVESGPA